MRKGRGRSRTGVYAAIVAIATMSATAVGVASAAQDATIAASGNDVVWHPPTVTIQPGEKVTWTFDTQGMPHNVHSSSSNWDFHPTGDFEPVTGSAEHIFPEVGRYDFVCRLHPGTMTGTVVVGDPGDPPDPDPDPDTTPTPTPTPAPSGGGSTTTPAPSPAPDTVKPAVGSLKLTAARRAVRVRFRLSEPATVTINVKRRGTKRVLKSARLQAPAGTRTVTLRSKRLTRGRYTVEIQARDAFGNRSSVARKSLALRR